MPATTFEAWGTYVYVATRRPRALTAAARLTARVLAEVDRACSRFRPDSDLSRVNAAAGSWVEVDPLLVEAVRVARDAAVHTDGLVDPLLGHHLVTLGYDRDLGLLPADREPHETTTVPTPGAWRRISLDPDGAVRIPAGTQLDLGATAKAWTADVVAAALAAELPGPALVSLGGDLVIAAPDGEPWRVAVSEQPGGPVGCEVGLDRGGLATSSTRVRRWTRGGVRRHHLVDPRTGLPAVETWTTVTATGPTCTAANTATTAAVVLGPRAPAWLRERCVDARLVAAAGDVVTTGSWPADTTRRSA